MQRTAFPSLSAEEFSLESFGKDGDPDGISGIHVIHGKITYPIGHDFSMHTPWECPCPTPLFAGALGLSSPLNLSVQSILLSQNRLVLINSPKGSLMFLHSLGSLVQDIRTTDLQFFAGIINEWMGPNSNLQYEWAKLIDFIIKNFTLGELVLSLDAGTCYEVYKEQLLN